MNDGPGVAGDERLERLEQPLERREAAAAERPLRVDVELLVALVALVHRIPEGHGIGGVDQHRQPELARGVEDRREPRVVRQDAPAVPVVDPQAEVLPHLHPGGTRVPRTREHRGLPLTAARVAQGVLPVDVDERVEAARMRPVVAIEVLLEVRQRAAVEVDDRLDSTAIHDVEQRADVLDHPLAVGRHPRREPAAEVVVRVDCRHGRALDERLGQHRPGAGQMIGETQLRGGRLFGGHRATVTHRWRSRSTWRARTGRSTSSSGQFRCCR